MQILAFNHFFDQDLDALRRALSRGEELTTIPYQRLWKMARRYFPADAFIGLERPYEDALRPAWSGYLDEVAEFASWLIAAYRPSVFITPSDSFFYLRPLIAQFSEFGVPTVVIQKETTIAPWIMDEHALEVGRLVPFMSAAMTVCSARHRQFWLRSGANSGLIVVTGQPRFDVYADHRFDRRAGRRRLLYLSYDDVAYLPTDLGYEFPFSWADLRRATEEILSSVAVAGSWEVTVKPHPGQSRQPDWLGPAVRRSERRADTRSLILDADLVVGFQTTALLEAAAAGRPVVYAAWGEVFERVRDDLIPFDAHPELALHAISDDHLRSILADPNSVEPPSASAGAVIEEHLGPVDGYASQRALHVIRQHASNTPTAPRVRLARRFAVGAARASASVPMALAARAANAAGEKDLAAQFDRRTRQWRQEAAEGVAVLRERWSGR